MNVVHRFPFRFLFFFFAEQGMDCFKNRVYNLTILRLEMGVFVDCKPEPKG